ncbi:MAG: zeta toxin family protein [Clostridiales Family XIII bacterium]|jgi:predicted ABC-type ATPase|nr:zeta toxin family protein [Clostridiales Family XIII bacterium]
MSTNDVSRKPVVLAFAGPNGSGKTTLSRNLSVFGTYVNADDLKNEYDLTDLDAAMQAETLRNALLDRGADFSFETVLSTDRNLLLLERAKARGYEIQCFYVLTCNENINVARAKARHAVGGHDVPEDKIRARYRSALALLPRLIALCDQILIYDNSDKPSLIFKKENAYSEIFPNDNWSEHALRKMFGL